MKSYSYAIFPNSKNEFEVYETDLSKKDKTGNGETKIIASYSTLTQAMKVSEACAKYEETRSKLG